MVGGLKAKKGQLILQLKMNTLEFFKEGRGIVFIIKKVKCTVESRVIITRLGVGVVWDKWGDSSQMVQTSSY